MAKTMLGEDDKISGALDREAQYERRIATEKFNNSVRKTSTQGRMISGNFLKWLFDVRY
jgi:hypothetical protein